MDPILTRKYFILERGILKRCKIEEELLVLKEVLDTAKDHLSMVGACDNVDATSCDHSWKVYDSGFSRYHYCEKCNEEKK